MNTSKSDALAANTPSSSHPGAAVSVLETPSPEQGEQDALLDSHVSISDRIRGVILQRISDGTYQPGERLKELALAHEFKVSQAPVRESFRSLESLGVLISEHYRGTHVRAISEHETEEVYQLRGHLEEIAAQLISPEILQQNFETIESWQKQMRSAALHGDMESYAHANIQFHRSIVGLATNQTILKVWDSLEIAMRARMNLQKKEKSLAGLAELHQPIVDALRQGDMQQTGRLLKEHSFSFRRILA
jgi:DNA-binding GntR family transcriptional regulator